jgi:A/G-specific adenine glycosylase
LAIIQGHSTCTKLPNNFQNITTKETIFEKNLYDFPIIETPKPVAPEDIHKTPLGKKLFAASETTVLNVSGVKKHLLSHQCLFIRFYYLSAPGTGNFPVQFHKINKKDIIDLPVPKVIENYLLEIFHDFFEKNV